VSPKCRVSNYVGGNFCGNLFWIHGREKAPLPGQGRGALGGQALVVGQARSLMTPDTMAPAMARASCKSMRPSSSRVSSSPGAAPLR